MLKPQDILIALKLIVKDNINEPWNFASIAKELHMSSSEVHAGFRRAVKSQLINQHTREPNRIALLEFIVHGLRYVFPAERGEITRGVPTALSASSIKSKLIESNELPLVWPSADGNIRGQALKPLYKSVPKAVESDFMLYELLALIDTIRSGRARERNLAIEKIKNKIGTKNETLSS
jgi:hypothetical protein